MLRGATQGHLLGAGAQGLALCRPQHVVWSRGLGLWSSGLRVLGFGFRVWGSVRLQGEVPRA